ncbi:MAG: M2 family metallopeptidase, partial [Thermoanaerobaculia bacterium]
MKTQPLPALILAAAVAACAPAADPGAESEAFLDDYHTRFMTLYAAAQEAEWASNTEIREGDDTNRKRTEETAAALADFTGSTGVIEKTRAFLEHRDELTDLRVRQLESVLYRAANYPQTVPEVVERRIAAEAIQVEKLYGFEFQLDGESITPNQIDGRLRESDDLGERLALWQASKEVGKGLKQGLAELVELRNATVQSLGYGDYFEYQVSDYGMSADEMMELNESFIREIWPLYRELHTWARHHLAERYDAEVPELLPAHWLPNRWGQDWAAMVTVEGLDLDAALADKTAEWVVREAE